MSDASDFVIPVADPVADNRTLGSDLVEAAATVIASGPYILGHRVREFERAFAKSLSAADAVGTGCGTDALVLALLGAGVRPGDEVIAPSHTAGPTIAAICMVGACPVFVDIDEATFNISPSAVDAAITPRVKAVIAVHLYGRPAEVDGLKAICSSAGIALIEDCAQAAGATFDGRSVGSFGAAGCFSFYPTKNLGAIGDGGCVVSSDTVFLERVRALRTYGWRASQNSELEFGRCSRLDELQAAILAVKLRHLDRWNARRREIAKRYLDELRNLPLGLPDCPAGQQHAYHLFVVRSSKRDALEAHLKANKIGTGRHYPIPVHKQPGLSKNARTPFSLTVTDQVCNEIISLPIFYAMTDGQIERVVSEIRKFFG